MNDDTATLSSTFTTNNSYINEDHYLAGTELDVMCYITDTDGRTTNIYDFSSNDLVQLTELTSTITSLSISMVRSMLSEKQYNDLKVEF